MAHRPIKLPSFIPAVSFKEILQGHRIVAFLLFAAIPLARLSFMPAFSARLYLIHLVVLAACIYFFVKSWCADTPDSGSSSSGVGERPDGRQLPLTITPIDILVFVFYTLYFSSYFFSRNRDISFTELLGESAYIGVYAIFRALLGNKERGGDFMRSAAVCITLCALALSAWGLLQYFFDFDVPGGLKQLFRTHHYPVVASMGNPNFLAEFLVFSVPVTVSYFTFTGRYRLLGAVLLVTGVTVYLTYSRLAWFALALVMIAMVLFASRESRWKIAAAFALIIAVCGSFFIYHYAGGSTRSERIIQTFAISDTTPLFERRVLYRAGLAMLADSGFTGMGPGAFGYHYLEYQGKVIAKDGDRFLRKHLVDLDHAHCDFIELGADGGYGVLAAYLVLLVWSSIAGIRLLLRRESGDPLRYVSLIPSVCVLFSMWSFPFYIPGSKLFYLFSLAYLSPRGGSLPVRVRRLFSSHLDARRTSAMLLLIALPFAICSGRYIKSVWHYNRGLQQFSRNFEAARAHFSSGILAYPLNGYNYFSMGALLLNKRKASGIAYMKESLKYLNNSTAYLNIARGYREHGNIAEAKKWYRRILYLRPDIRRAWIEYRQIIDGKR